MKKLSFITGVLTIIIITINTLYPKMTIWLWENLFVNWRQGLATIYLGIIIVFALAVIYSIIKLNPNRETKQFIQKYPEHETIIENLVNEIESSFELTMDKKFVFKALKRLILRVAKY